MLKNYFTIAVRNVGRNKIFSLINISGLAIGIAVFVFIAQYVAFEWSTNRFHKNFNQLYRLNVVNKGGNAGYYVPPGLGPVMKNNVAGVEAYTRVADGIGSGVVSYATPSASPSKEGSFREENISYVDGNFFDVFSFPLVAGNRSLQQPKTVALSEGIAKKYFGTGDVIGKVVTVSNQFGNTPYTITTVYKDMPEGSDIQSKILLSFKTLESAANRNENDWANPATTESGFTNTYFLLKKGADGKRLSGQLTRFLQNSNPRAKEDKVVLQPFRELHLAPHFTYPLQTFGNLKLVVVFGCVALLILVIAWVNYINLSTAQALKRAKEVGVRKVLGASRTQLIFQYLTETFLVTLTAVCFGLLLVQLLQYGFNNFTGRHLSLAVLNEGRFWLSGSVLVITGSLLAGTYVAFVLSSFKPIKAIQGKVEGIKTAFSMRKVLVVFQFTVSIVFIIATLVLYRQLQYMQTQKLGMNLDQLMVIKGPTVSSDDQAERNLSFKNGLGQLSFVKSYAASNNVPGGGYNFSADGITRLNPQPDDDKKNYSMFICDERFFDTYKIDFAGGNNFTAEDAANGWSKAKKVILNEKAAAQLGFEKGESIIGKKILWGEPFEIIGIIKDYHHLSLQQAIKPVIYLPSVSFVYFTIQTDITNLPSKLNIIKRLYRKEFASNPFDYFFADERFNLQYKEEQKLGSVLIAAAFVAVLIACMGLFGLASFSAQQRVKEIGIRKVLGATVNGIVVLLSKDFLKLVIISAVIAFPLAGWAMNSWLQSFAYRTTISWWVFAIAGMGALLIALLTIGWQTVKAAIANPVKNLRTE